MNCLKNLMKKTAKVKKLITHDGSFHSDDIFACATLCLMLEKSKKKFKIIRARDEKIIKTGDYVFDVGGICDAEKNRFDHHQAGGVGKRLNGIEYASFGLVWKKFGLAISDSEAVAELIDERLISPIDAYDNGFNLFEKKHKISPFLIQDFFKLMRPTWKEPPEDHNKNFLKAVNIAKEALSRSIIHGRDTILAEKILAKAYRDAENKKIIILDRYCPFGNTFDKFPEPLFIIFPREGEDVWIIKTINREEREFISRKDFPKKWGGLQNKELQKITGIPEAIFCHKNLFMAVAKTKAGAIKLARIAVES